MWSRSELKRRAKQNMKKYYWMALLVCLIAGILGAGDGIRVNLNMGTAARGMFIDGNVHIGEIPGGNFHYGVSNPASSVLLAMITFLGMFSLLLMAGAILFRIFVGNVIAVGRCRYFLESRYYEKSADLGALFWGFKSGSYMNIVSIMFLRDLYLSLWTLLLVIPGIVKSYEYKMIPFLLADDPSMSKDDAFHITKEMTEGSKMSIFVLDLSFIGWTFLGSLLCGIGVIFVDPYYQMVAAELYSYIKDEHNWYAQNTQTIDGTFQAM